MPKSCKQYGNVIVIEDTFQNRNSLMNQEKDDNDDSDDFVRYKSKKNVADLKKSAKRLEEQHKKNVEHLRNEGELLDYESLVRT